MDSDLKALKALLHQYGNKVDAKKALIEVTSTECIDANVPDYPGVYWVETTMPVEDMKSAISNVLGKEKKVRRTPPPGVSIIEQEGDSLYVAYSGTEEDWRKRLKQHLFNQGHAKTVKLCCVIDEKPFSQYRWRVGFAAIDSYEIRYAVEAWWRLNKGWPKFCLR
ncbi:hypothetical protein [Halomonas sp. YLGW01]|uniref:hypothetical protein n=1 Tax=Halomonas sp. YLGW01 TaxID=2773308 RepID=UPI00177F84C9|nr:hypothetical protein [Halomonas sp. YLGW01]